MNYETEAVLLEIAKEKGAGSKCRLKAVAGGTAVEIKGNRYLVGRNEKKATKAAGAGKGARTSSDKGCLWQLDSDWRTLDEFGIRSGLEQYAFAAWQGQRKVHLVISDANSITRITLL